MPNIEQLRSQIYEKYRIDVDPKDPIFQIFALLIENNQELERERLEVLEKRVNEIVKAAETSVHLQTEAARETTRDMIKGLVAEIRKELSKENVNIRDNSRKSDKNHLLLWGFCVITIILSMNLVINFLLLYRPN